MLFSKNATWSVLAGASGRGSGVLDNSARSELLAKNTQVSGRLRRKAVRIVRGRIAVQPSRRTKDAHEMPAHGAVPFKASGRKLFRQADDRPSEGRSQR